MRAGFAGTPWTVVSPLVQLDSQLSDYDYLLYAHYAGQVLSPEVDGNANSTSMGILAMELKVAGGSGIPVYWLRA
jgi:hypothetical protein